MLSPRRRCYFTPATLTQISLRSIWMDTLCKTLFQDASTLTLKLPVIFTNLSFFFSGIFFFFLLLLLENDAVSRGDFFEDKFNCWPFVKISVDLQRWIQFGDIS